MPPDKPAVVRRKEIDLLALLFPAALARTALAMDLFSSIWGLYPLPLPLFGQFRWGFPVQNSMSSVMFMGCCDLW